MTPRALALLAAAAFGLFVIVLSGELRAQAPPALFGEPAIEAPVRSDDRLFVTRARTTSVRFDLLSAALAKGFAGDRAPAFTLNLFDDAVYSVAYERFERNDFGHQTWVGRIVGDPLSTVTFTWSPPTARRSSPTYRPAPGGSSSTPRTRR